MKRILAFVLAAIMVFVLSPIARATGGSIVLSTQHNATLGGMSFEDGDLVEYDPTTNTSTLFFDESLFSGDEDIDAVHVLSNGNIILSTTANSTLGGLTLGHVCNSVKNETLFFE